MNGPYPLCVSPFEFAMVADDRPTHPMTFGVRLEFDRPLDLDAFAAAITDSAAGHPRLVGRVDGLDATRPVGARWLPAEDAIPVERGPMPELPRPINLRRGPSLRLTLSDDRALLLEFHHAAIDGRGVLQVLEDVLRLSPHDPDGDGAGLGVSERRPQITFPHTAGLSNEEPVRIGKAARTAFAARRIASFFRCRPRALTVPSGPAGGAAWHRATLTVAETDNLRIAAKGCGVTVNDLLVRELFLALESWNASLGRPGGVVRVCVPMSTRTEQTGDSANSVSMVMLDRVVRRTTADSLLRSIAAEMAHVRRQRQAQPLLLALAALARVPGGIRRVYAANRCQATATASNIGVAFAGRTARFGGATLRDIHVLPPVRPLTRFVAVALTYAGRLNIGAATDPTVLSAASGRRLVGRYVDRLRAFATARAL